MQKAKARPHRLTAEQEEAVAKLTAELPSNWVALFIEKNEEIFNKTYSRTHAYNILKGCRTDHAGWKVIQSIAQKHQELLASL